MHQALAKLGLNPQVPSKKLHLMYMNVLTNKISIEIKERTRLLLHFTLKCLDSLLLNGQSLFSSLYWLTQNPKLDFIH